MLCDKQKTIRSHTYNNIWHQTPSHTCKARILWALCTIVGYYAKKYQYSSQRFIIAKTCCYVQTAMYISSQNYRYELISTSQQLIGETVFQIFADKVAVWSKIGDNAMRGSQLRFIYSIESHSSFLHWQFQFKYIVN